MTQDDSTPRSDNITWHHGTVTHARRAEVFGHQGATVWLTGLSGSGKSTVARAFEAALVERGVHAYVLDGDNVRHGLNRDLGFAPEDRAENIRRIGEVSRLFTDAGVLTIAAFISPYRADRDRVRALHAPGTFFEVHLDVPLEVCESRDPKGLYQKARSGEIKGFTGISAPYEAPKAPEITLHTHTQSLDECVQTLIEGLGDILGSVS